MVRVRFAPSPTGLLHVGNARTALFNWLLCRSQDGAFILRIEDTDSERSRPEFETQLLKDLRWLGLDWNEGPEVGGDFGPYRQTERFHLYRERAERLIVDERAYHCFCSLQELEKERSKLVSAGKTPRYSGRCRGLSSSEARRRLAAGQLATVRLRVDTERVHFEDVVFGSLDVDARQFGDFIILRSDGRAQYNFAVVIDDTLMKISHVVRGEGHLSNTARQVLLYEALGYSLPRFVHLSTILGPDGSKLSKRHGATSLSEFRQEGYLPESLLNYLALLGWTPEEAEDSEIMTPEALIQTFDLKRLNKSPATFDRAKLNWVNRAHLKSADTERLVELVLPHLREAQLIPEDPAAVRDWIEELLVLFLPYIDTLKDLPDASATVFDFNPEKAWAEGDVQRLFSEEASRRVVSSLQGHLRMKVFREIGYAELLQQVKEGSNAKGKLLFQPLRFAMTGSVSGPDLQRLLPLIDRASELDLPTPVISLEERVQRTAALLARLE